ncbi:hypothetical protein GJ744_008583 [Endocarpon pusillum]|uniref:Uncharacterized protein n=1 Tax=Endocarpon pusillum TaxID=364733 RepID=A0A8H7AIQ1_9EURO|nr:hypothetical protein GJ744_008583 [Endocarpon pusillum]
MVGSLVRKADSLLRWPSALTFVIVCRNLLNVAILCRISLSEISTCATLFLFLNILHLKKLRQQSDLT